MQYIGLFYYCYFMLLFEQWVSGCFCKKTEWRKRRFGESLELSRQEWEMGHKSGQLLLAIISGPVFTRCGLSPPLACPLQLVQVQCPPCVRTQCTHHPRWQLCPTTCVVYQLSEPSCNSLVSPPPPDGVCQMTQQATVHIDSHPHWGGALVPHLSITLFIDHWISPLWLLDCPSMIIGLPLYDYWIAPLWSGRMQKDYW